MDTDSSASIRIAGGAILENEGQGMAKKKKRRSAKTAGPKSRLWQRKADKAFSDQERARVGNCELCGKLGLPRKDGLEVVGLDLHHLIERGRFRFRYDSANVVILCTSHHGSHPNFRNRKIAAHGSMDVYENFTDWLKRAKPEQWKWYQDNKHDKRLVDGTYKEKYKDLVR